MGKVQGDIAVTRMSTPGRGVIEDHQSTDIESTNSTFCPSSSSFSTASLYEHES